MKTQIVAILKEADAGVVLKDLWRKHGISSAADYSWKAKYGGLDASQLKRLKELEGDLGQYIERFNRTYRDEALDLYLFETLEQVREITHRWLIDYNEHRPHDSLRDLTPIEYAENARSSSSQSSA